MCRIEKKNMYDNSSTSGFGFEFEFVSEFIVVCYLVIVIWLLLFDYCYLVIVIWFCYLVLLFGFVDIEKCRETTSPDTHIKY